MKSVPRPTTAKSSRVVTLLCVVICCGSLMTAFIVGISNNLPGLTMCYLAAISIILAFVHTWRRVKYFLILSAASVIGFFGFALLHNVFYALGIMASDIIVLHYLPEVLHVVSFLIAIFVCPAGFLIGAVGSVVTVITYFKKRQTQNRSAQSV